MLYFWSWQKCVFLLCCRWRLGHTCIVHHSSFKIRLEFFKKNIQFPIWAIYPICEKVFSTHERHHLSNTMLAYSFSFLCNENQQLTHLPLFVPFSSLRSHCISQILESVNHIHQHDIVHRDLKVSGCPLPWQPHTRTSARGHGNTQMALGCSVSLRISYLSAFLLLSFMPSTDFTLKLFSDLSDCLWPVCLCARVLALRTRVRWRRVSLKR